MTFQTLFFNRISKFLALFVFFISIAIATQAQSIDPNNLSNVRIDDLSDEQVLSILKQGQDAGLTLEQAQALAAKKGLPASEMQKLKDRVAKIQTNKVGLNEVEDNAESKIAAKILDESEKADLVTGKVEDVEGAGRGAKITVYGQEYFRNSDIKIFDKSTDAKAPANYVIGIGDELGLSVFGYSYFNEVLKVDARGAINPSQMGPIFIKGLTFEKAKTLIRAKMNQYFDLNNNKLEVTLAYSRSITVNIVGEVAKPGSYKIPAVNTAFNALILAGGPNDLGTLRSIQIRRDGKTVKILDVYAFLTDPNSKQDYFLEDNDYIVVNSSKKVVRISGEIKKTASYELLESEGLNELIKFAGGLTSNAYSEKIQLKRNASKEIKIIDLSYDSLLNKKGNFALFNGDQILIRPSVSEIINKITSEGSFNFPGDYNFKQGLRVSDLLSISGDYKIDADAEHAYIVRTKNTLEKEYIRVNLIEIKNNPSSAQNVLLKPLDVLVVNSHSEFLKDQYVEIFGSVKNPTKFNYVPGMKLFDLIRQAGGFTIEAENLRIELARLSYYAPTYIDGEVVRTIVERINLSNLDLIGSDTSNNYELRPFDEVFIRAVPNFYGYHNVELKGEVKYPGIYPLLTKNDKITDVIKRAGGLTNYAFKEASTFYRQELDGRYIVLKLDKALSSEYSKYNYVLKDKDLITIPTVTDFVSIRGSSVEAINILNTTQINAPYYANRRAKYYINKYGNGFSRNSLRRKTYVIQPNAKVNRTRNLIVFKIYPKVTKGSVIYVVDKVKKQKDEKTGRVEWNKVIENTTVKLTGLATLYILFSQLK